MTIIPELPELGGELVEHFMRQPGFDEGLATGAALSVLRTVTHQAKSPYLDLPDGRGCREVPRILVIDPADFDAKAVEEAARELGGGIQSWAVFASFHIWDELQVIIPFGGRDSTAVTKTPPSPELLAHLAEAKKKPVIVTSDDGAREFYEQKGLGTLRTWLSAVEDRWLMVALYLAVGTHKQVVTAEILETARIIAVDNHYRARQLLEVTGAITYSPPKART